MPEFEKGSIVKLKAGSPDLTVIETAFSKIQVAWFNKEGNLQKEWIPQEALIKKISNNQKDYQSLNSPPQLSITGTPSADLKKVFDKQILRKELGKPVFPINLTGCFIAERDCENNYTLLISYVEFPNNPNLGTINTTNRQVVTLPDDVTAPAIVDARMKIVRLRIQAEYFVVPSKEKFDSLLKDSNIEDWFCPNDKKEDIDNGYLGIFLGMKVVIQPVKKFKIYSEESLMLGNYHGKSNKLS